MSATVRLAAYGVAVALMFGGGAALGSALGPDPSPGERTTTIDHDGATDVPTHEGDH